MSNLSWSSFEPKFGTWANKIKPFFDSGGFDSIYGFLKEESRRGKLILPPSHLVFRAFQETPFENLKVVMAGMSPYHTLRNKLPIADGLLMGCSTTNYLQPSLSQFYSAIENEMYKGRSYIRNPDVKFLAGQGVLMLNTSLSVEYLKAGSHVSIWEPFIKYLFEEVLSGTNAPIIFLGKEAAKCKKYVSPFTWTFEVSHPASAAYSHTDWNTEGVFQKVNKVLWDSNGWTIEWLDLSKDVLF